MLWWAVLRAIGCMYVCHKSEWVFARVYDHFKKSRLIHLVFSTDASALRIEQEIIGNGGECSGVFVRACWYAIRCKLLALLIFFWPLRQIKWWSKFRNEYLESADADYGCVFHSKERRNCIIASAVQKSKLIFVCVFLSHVPYWYYIFGLCV